MWWEHLGTQFEHLLLLITIQCNCISMQLSQTYSKSLPKFNTEVGKLCFWIHAPWPVLGVCVPLPKPGSQIEDAASQATFTILWTFYMWVHTLPFIGTKPSHACVFLLPYMRWFCLLWLKPQQWHRPTTALTPPAGRDAPSHLLCLRVFATQTEHSSPILKYCNASSVLVVMNSLPKLNKAFYSISHLHSAIGKCFVREHCITFENEPFSKFREEVGDNHINSHLPIPTPVPYI